MIDDVTTAPGAAQVSIGLARTTHPSDWLDRGMATVDSGYRVLSMDDAIARWLEIDPVSAAGADLTSLIHAVRPGLSEPVRELFRSEAPIARREVAVACNGSEAWYAVEVARCGDASFFGVNSILPPAEGLGETGWDQYLDDRQARRELYVRLMRAEDRLQSLVGRWPGVVFSQRADFCFSFASPRIEALTGLSPSDFERQSGLFWQVVHEADTTELQRHISRLSPQDRRHTGTYRIRHFRTGRVAYVLEHREALFSQSGLLLGYEVVWLDVTRQTIAENRLSSAAWKETLAVLTMGLAHDFSNIMAGIHSLSETFQSQMEKDHAFQEGLALIRRNSMQASQLVHRILNLHHGKLGSRNYHDLNELLPETLDLMRKAIPKRIAVEQRLASVRIPLYVDPVEFRQVLVNLALNAVDAMPDGGRLVFETSRHDAPPPLGHTQGAFPRLPAACVTVQDTGCGIPAKRLPSVFDPFFTTKAMNKGSGLGLYNARLFVEKHHGAISVESSEGRGTTFRLWLPEADFTEAERTALESERTRHSILLVGEPGPLLDTTSAHLRQNGFYVLTASSEQAAFDSLSEPDYLVSAVLVQAATDGIPAGDVFARAHGAKPAVRTILHVVGCSKDDVDSSILNRADLIIPPDTPNPDMISRIHSLLERTSEGFV